MTIFNQGYEGTPSTGGTSSNAATDWLITRLAVTVSTEQSHTFQSNCKGFMIRHDKSKPYKVATASGETATKPFNMTSGNSFTPLTDLDFTGKTVYLLSAYAGTFEIVEFYA